MRLINANGQQAGIVRTSDAIDAAEAAGLDLVEVAPDADPPVAKILDYGRFKYEQSVREREARRKQVHTEIKEMKFRPRIDPHDYATKKGHVLRFLTDGDRVKVTVMFRGREQSRPELGLRLLRQLAADLADVAQVVTEPVLTGRDMTMLLAPRRAA